MKKDTQKPLALTMIAVGLLIWSTEYLPSRAAATAAVASSAAFEPPSDNDIPAGKLGDSVRLGEKIFREPDIYATAYVGNDLRCSSCHLQEGRLAGASPMWAAYVAYPAYRAKNGHVNSFEERLQGCFRYSMNGKAPPLGDPVLIALESYSYFLAKGLPTDEPAPGRGFPRLPKPPLTADYARGSEVYAQKCTACHGADGHGQSAEGKVSFPPLWGPRSYNWGAGMTSIKSAAEFIRANMPLGAGGTLSVQQAWDVATYIDSQVRPQDPRFTGDVDQTRKMHHDTPFSMYGRTVNGAILGDPASTPPAGTVPGDLPAHR
jgi:thiosulfate dehydrogenase